jgi:hypothetical protein
MNLKGGATSITRTRVGAGFDFQDNAGDVFTTLVTEGGYRLMCSKLPAQYTVQVVFALATLDSKLIQTLRPPRNPPPGKDLLSFAELAGLQSYFELFDSRPSPCSIHLKGRYAKGLKPFNFEATVTVQDGN